MDALIDLWTDGAMLALFDPAVFLDEKPEPQHRFHLMPAVRDGLFAAVGLQYDCRFRLRVTDSDLSPRERELLNDTVGPLGLRVRSGSVYATGMDFPGDPVDVYARHGAGGFVSVPPGEYDVTFYEIQPGDAPAHEADLLPDVVAVVRPRAGTFPGVHADPFFDGGQALRRHLRKIGADVPPPRA